MLTSGMGMVRGCPDVERAVNELLTADTNYDRHHSRSVHRQHLVRYLVIKIRKPEQSVVGVSRHISNIGIEVIIDHEIAEGTIGEIDIERLKGPPIRIIAECRWCRNFGENRFILGWQFKSIKR